MLADRFGLKIHRVPVEVEGYALTVAKRGPKLTVSQPGDVAPPEYRDMGGGKAHLIKSLDPARMGLYKCSYYFDDRLYGWND